MRIRICPECKMAFYSLGVAEYQACYHCGFIFSRRRGSERKSKVMGFNFYLGGSKKNAVLQDYSDDGIRMVYQGNHLDENTFVEVDINELNIRRIAKIVWLKKNNGEVTAGLMYMEKELNKYPHNDKG